MKRIFTGLLATLMAVSTMAATKYPLSLMDATGSTSGQFIVSTGPTTAPTFATVTLAGIGGVLPVANGGTGVTTASAEVSRLSAAVTTGTLAQFAPTTSAQLAGVISDETGSGPLVFATAPTITLPNATGLPISTGVSGLGTGVAAGLASAVTGSGGVVLATSPTITTPNITGVTSGACATAGSVGECPAAGTGSGVAFANATPLNCASVSLAAGDYLVWGDIVFTSTGLMTSGLAGVSTTSNALPAVPGTAGANGITFGSSSVFSVAPPMAIVKLTATTTVYLVGQTTFSSGGVSGACSIWQVRFH